MSVVPVLNCPQCGAFGNKIEEQVGPNSKLRIGVFECPKCSKMSWSTILLPLRRRNHNEISVP